ncbi:hypothetical protein PENARI_c062G07387 [Penicillium arizonense]|uniref:Uncharacterized protein n=1 Tax=Penicillium arizonense TaxID=1835702 RepID=A0A1F5L238_PENAI|nr:hypothetical protein PENARI_c062G07387 [Penicillium arizonense]OGE47116.1 hypothetical protein PENARI_c062G07387 [Penicillium arizonense]
MAAYASIVLAAAIGVYPKLMPKLITAAIKPATTPKVAASEEVPSPPSSVTSSLKKFMTPKGTPAPEESLLRRLLRRSS